MCGPHANHESQGHRRHPKDILEVSGPREEQHNDRRTGTEQCALPYRESRPRVTHQKMAAGKVRCVDPQTGRPEPNADPRRHRRPANDTREGAPHQSMLPTGSEVKSRVRKRWPRQASANVPRQSSRGQGFGIATQRSARLLQNSNFGTPAVDHGRRRSSAERTPVTVTTSASGRTGSSLKIATQTA